QAGLLRAPRVPGRGQSDAAAQGLERVHPLPEVRRLRRDRRRPPPDALAPHRRSTRHRRPAGVRLRRPGELVSWWDRGSPTHQLTTHPPMSTCSIRSYRPADLPRIRQITVDSFEGVSIDRNIEARFGPVAGRRWKERKARDVAQDCAVNPAGVFVAELDGD